MNEKPSMPFKNYFPNLSLNAYFWLVIGLSALIFGIGGYFVGIRVSQLPSSTPYQQVSTVFPTPTIPGGDSDASVSTIGGAFTTDTNYYDQLVVNVDSIQNGVKTGLDTDYRYITKPQAGVQYPFSFLRLDPSKSYIVSASACTTNPKTYALICAKHIKIINCSGTLQGSSCIIKGNGIQQESSGEVDFSLSKADNPLPKNL